LTDAIERAHVKDAVGGKEYAETVGKLLRQFNVARDVAGMKEDDAVLGFMRDHRLVCRAAQRRLLEEGAVGDHGKPDDSAKHVAEVTQYFITAMDAVKLDMRSVDALHPLLTDLVEALGRLTSMPVEWDGKRRLQGWLSRMHAMKASDELDEDEARQILFDLESAYTAFTKSL
jgi:ESCRT-I complex subunit VPS28